MGRSRYALNSVNSAVFSPSPMPRVITTVSTNPGILRSKRMAKRRSCNSVVMGVKGETVRLPDYYTCSELSFQPRARCQNPDYLAGDRILLERAQARQSGLTVRPGWPSM